MNLMAWLRRLFLGVRGYPVSRCPACGGVGWHWRCTADPRRHTVR